MSMAALRWARSVRGISSTQKLILWALADSANDYGEAWPSALLLAEDCCLTDRTVRDALDALERMRLITGQRETGRATRWTVEVGSTPERASETSEAASETSEAVSGVNVAMSTRGDPGNCFRPTPEGVSDPPRKLLPTTPETASYRTLKNPHSTLSEPPKGAKRRAVVLPPWLPTPAWADWVKFRRSQKGWTDKLPALPTLTPPVAHALAVALEPTIGRGRFGEEDSGHRITPPMLRPVEYDEALRAAHAIDAMLAPITARALPALPNRPRTYSH